MCNYAGTLLVHPRGAPPAHSGAPLTAASSERPTTSIVDDPNRLETLASYHILDTAYELAFDGIVKMASLVFEAPIAVINFVDANRQWFKAEVGLGIRETPLDVSICRHAILEQELLVINDTLLDLRTAGNPLVKSAERSLRFYAGALLKSGEYPLGTLCVLDHKPREFSSAQLDCLMLMRDQVMHLLQFRRHHHAQRQLLQQMDQAHDELSRLSMVDPLTGLLNRRAIEQRLRIECDAQLHGDLSGAVLMIDLDNFKHVNDRHGHLNGDHVLKKVGKLLQQATRGSDVLSRWGGDEFLVLLPNADADQAHDVATRILDTLAGGMASQPECCQLGASIGICALRGHASVSAVLQAADAAMYQAKRSVGPEYKISIAAHPGA